MPRCDSRLEPCCDWGQSNLRFCLWQILLKKSKIERLFLSEIKLAHTDDEVRQEMA
jgi:hypothetical protein